MIDEKTLAEDEAELKRLQHHYRAYPDMTENLAKRAEIIRLARRYLALRDHGIYIEEQGDVLVYEEQLDAAADRLLEGGE